MRNFGARSLKMTFCKYLLGRSEVNVRVNTKLAQLRLTLASWGISLIVARTEPVIWNQGIQATSTKNTDYLIMYDV